MFDLTGKTALVTGATGGLGSAIARSLHAQGAHVVLSGTREAVLQDLAAELGERTSVAACNLSDAEQVDGLVAKAEALGGELSILVANAGITKDGLLMRMKDEDWEQVIKVNLESYFRLSRAALRGMMKRRYGRIIGVTSVVGVTGNPGQTNYAASKAGMIGFSKSLAQEVGSRGVTVNCIAPGSIEFPGGSWERRKTEAPALYNGILNSLPLGRLGRPEEVANVVLFFASPLAGWVTAQVVQVNGGQGFGR